MPSLIAAPNDYLPPPGSLGFDSLTFREGNVDQPLCVEIIIVDDSVPEELETFRVNVGFSRSVGVTGLLRFHPVATTVTVIDDDIPGK